MDKRLTFNEDAANYDKWRPRYCTELFQDIIAYSDIGPGRTAIEVGIGTGQATRPFLETGCTLTAIELGEDLAEYTKSKFREFENFTIYHSSFEQFSCPAESADLIYSATAFHWIPEEAGYPKVYQLLKSKGTLALFWNRPFVSREDDELHQRIQRIYQRYRPSKTKIIKHDTERYSRISKMIGDYGFRDVQVKLYHLTRTFSADDYIALLNTYSDHVGLPSVVKGRFEDEIREAILVFDDELRVYDTIDVYLAKK